MSLAAGRRLLHGILSLFALLGSLCHSPREARADIIHLRNGNQIQGEVLERGEDHVTVRFPGGQLKIFLKDILKIEKEGRLKYLLAEGEKHLRRKDFEGALSLFRTATEEFPESDRARSLLIKAQEKRAHHLYEIRRLGEAWNAYRDLLNLHPESQIAEARIAAIERELEEAKAEVSRGAREIQRGKVSEGYSRLMKVYERFPELRSQLAPLLGRAALTMGNREFFRQNFEEAERRYLEAIELQPDLVPGMAAQFASIKIRQLQPFIEEGRFEALLKESEEALAVVPTNEILLYFRGLALEGLGRPREAAEVYLRVSGVQKPKNTQGAVEFLRRAAEARILGKTESASGSEEPPLHTIQHSRWREKITDHFIVYYRNNRVGREVAAVAEDVYRRLYRQLNCKTHWYKRCRIYIHPTKKDFLAATGRHNWTGGSHKILRRRGTLTDHRIDSFQTQPRLTATVIPHEVAHAMLAHRLSYRGEIPLWINEGFAIRTEPVFVHRHYRRVVARAMQLGILLKVTDLIQSRAYPEPDKVQLFYAQSFSLCDYLIEEEGLKTFLDFAGALSMAPSSVGPLLRRHYKIAGPRALETLWRKGISRK